MGRGIMTTNLRHPQQVPQNRCRNHPQSKAICATAPLAAPPLGSAAGVAVEHRRPASVASECCSAPAISIEAYHG
jgi:hypothetical protein